MEGSVASASGSREVQPVGGRSHLAVDGVGPRRRSSSFLEGRCEGMLVASNHTRSPMW